MRETAPAPAAPGAVPGAAPAGAGVALRCRGLVKRYGDLVAVDALDLEVARGECFGLLGPNGAGKTTTIEILEGLSTADAGEVDVLGLRWGATIGSCASASASSCRRRSSATS